MLQGTIHPNTSLFGLPRLKRLNLAFNQFYHSKLPSEIGRFSNSLTHLNISQCWFSGNVPTDTTLVSKLVSLDLSDNDFDLKLHVLKDMFQNFTNLEELSLGRVDISSILPTSLNISSSLTLLNLGSTGLYGILAHNMFKIHSLETLDLSQNSFTGDIPREISFLPNLVSLDLSGSWNDYFRIQPHVFENLLKNSTLLRYLSLNQVYIGSVLPSYLNFTSLKSLDLSSTTLQGKLTDNVFNLQNLEVLTTVKQ
ncbi:leucine-rich repeat-containing protein [Tanacetum coccineum]